MVTWLHRATLVGLLISPIATVAQQQPAALVPPESGEWAGLPHMQLERQFAGPLQDTIIQRWRDPVDGTVCYLYLPITAAHSAPTASGFVQYGGNAIGSLSCMAPSAAAAAAASASKHPPPPGAR